MYNCGPTVYDYAHIGNLRAYIFSDILKKTLESQGYKLTQVINITDVGHLTEEEEDKIEMASQKEDKSAKEIARFYENAFKKDLEKLNISKPDYTPRATEHIEEQIELIEKIEDNNIQIEDITENYVRIKQN